MVELVAPVSVQIMLGMYFMRRWFTLSDPAMDEALHDMPLFLEFAGLCACVPRVIDSPMGLPFCAFAT